VTGSASIPLVSQPTSVHLTAADDAPGFPATRPNSRPATDGPDPKPGARLGLFNSVVRQPWLPPLILLLLAAVLRFRGLDAQSLWLDEGMSVFFVNLGLDKLWEVTFVREPNPPLYYVLLWAWVHVFGQGEIALRSLSALLGTLAVLPAYFLGRDLGGSRAGWLAGLATAASSFLLWYSQEARAFALLGTTSAGLIWATNRGTQSTNPRMLATWVAFAVVTLYSHIYGAFAFAAAALTLALVGRPRFPWRIIAAAVPTLLFAPWLIATLIQSAAARGWRAPVTLDELLLNTAATVSHGGVLTGGPGWAVVTLLCVPAIVGWLALNPRSRILIGLAVVLPLVAAYALSFIKPIFAERYLIEIAVPLYVAAGAGLAALSRRVPVLGPVAALALLALLAASLVAYAQPRFEKENFRAGAERVAQSAGPNDLILFVAEFAQRPFEYYYHGPGELVGFFGDHRNPGSFLEPVLAKADTVWLVESHTERYDPDHQVRQWLADRYPVATEAYPQGINIRAFRARYTASTRPSSTIATFGDLRLSDAQFPPLTSARDVQLHPPSAWLPVSLHWSVGAPVETDYRLVLELVDGRGVWGRSLDRAGDLFHKVPTHTWRTELTMVESMDVNLNPDTPPGRYVLQLAVFDAAGNPVPSSVGGPLQLGEVEVRP
jgi:mannosyltransferase